jgi:negative regulator of flagellin synthesis FlgM
VFSLNINAVNRAIGIYSKSNSVKPGKKSEAVKKQDKLEISASGKDYQFAIDQLKKLPETREEKVEAIKKRVDSGSYEVNAKAIADKIYKSSHGKE